MATIDVKYTCGCGFSTKVVEAAVQHSNTQRHSLTALGMINKPTFTRIAG